MDEVYAGEYDGLTEEAGCGLVSGRWRATAALAGDHEKSSKCHCRSKLGLKRVGLTLLGVAFSEKELSSSTRERCGLGDRERCLLVSRFADQESGTSLASGILVVNLTTMLSRSKRFPSVGVVKLAKITTRPDYIYSDGRLIMNLSSQAQHSKDIIARHRSEDLKLSKKADPAVCADRGSSP